ncbi:hypothetical protein ACN47E_009224 [Coniothyrium glycines]
MLHEILLSLSGHPSALFDADPGTAHVTSAVTRLLSPPEEELLSSIGHLSRLHRKIRDHVARIAASHPSTVCRAVATSITSQQLAKFQQTILQVERRILKQDASTVGAYNIVPLAGLVGEFSEWVRLMEWLWQMAEFMVPFQVAAQGVNAEDKTASGADLIDRLRNEAQTGFPDIEEAARSLGKVAETSWLRQLSTWLLYGRLPSFGKSDFFIQLDDEDSDDPLFILHNKLLPKFVSRRTAQSILFVGKSLTQIRALPSAVKTLNLSRTTVSELDLLPKHVHELSQVTAPIASARLSEAVAKIRLSLSQNLLQHLLPREKIVETLTVLHQFFLIGRGEFAMALIAEADNQLQSRHRGQATKSSQPMKGVLLKEAEVNQILARSLSVLSTISSEDEHTDDILDIASRLLRLNAHSSSGHRPGTPGRAKDMDNSLPQLPNSSFDELLLSVPSSLTMDIQSPLDLFVTKADLDVYSAINAYLLGIRRAHLHIAQLWRHSSIRRDHPCPPGYQYSNSPHGKAILAKRRQRTTKRARDMRKVWATCAAAIFFLAESEAYFQGGVVQQSFTHFLAWVSGSSSTSSSADASPSSQDRHAALPTTTTTTKQHDPEVLALAHRIFLSSLAHALLLTDRPFTTLVRTCCTHIDELVAYTARLTSLQQRLDLQDDEGIEDAAPRDAAREESLVRRDLDRARKRLDADLKALVERLREVDGESVRGAGTGMGMGMGMGTRAPSARREEGAYEPVRVGGIDRLLMKLDWGGEEEQGEDEGEDLL